MPKSRTIPRLLDELVETYPTRPAVVGSGRRWTYSDLQDDVMKVARRLFRLGVGKGDKVGILMGNNPEWISSALAIVSLGATMVSVNTWATARELDYLIRHSDCKYLIATPTFLKADYREMLKGLEPLTERFPLLRGILGVGEGLPDNWEPLYDGKVVADVSSDELIRQAFAAVQPTDLAYLIYTSGSTSTPKGVEILHYGLIENPWHIGERLHVTENDRVWLAVSLYWGMGCQNALMNSLTHGACIVLQEYFDAGEAMRLIEREKCTVYYGATHLASAMLDHPDLSRYDLSTMKHGASAGTPEQLRQVIKLGVTYVCQMYGLTETYANSHINDAGDSLERRLESCGRPLSGFSQKIAAPDGRELAPGEDGELLLKGYITPGYYKDEAVTAQSFDQDGYFRTGDLCFVDKDGYMYFRGRLKELVKTNGLNVAPVEVEVVLTMHPAVYLAQVVGIPDASRDEILAALVVTKPGASVTAEELTLFCRSNLSAYKVPRLIRFVKPHELPLTSTGKIQKNRIAKMFFFEEEV